MPLRLDSRDQLSAEGELECDVFGRNEPTQHPYQSTDRGALGMTCASLLTAPSAAT